MNAIADSVMLIEAPPPVAPKKQPRGKPASRGRGRPPRKGKPLNVRLKPGLKEALDGYVEGLRPNPGITAIVEMIIEDFLVQNGAWEAPSSPSQQQDNID